MNWVVSMITTSPSQFVYLRNTHVHQSRLSFWLCLYWAFLLSSISKLAILQWFPICTTPFQCFLLSGLNMSLLSLLAVMNARLRHLTLPI